MVDVNCTRFAPIEVSEKLAEACSIRGCRTGLAKQTNFRVRLRSNLFRVSEVLLECCTEIFKVLEKVSVRQFNGIIPLFWGTVVKIRCHINAFVAIANHGATIQQHRASLISDRNGSTSEDFPLKIRGSLIFGGDFEDDGVWTGGAAR